MIDYRKICVFIIIYLLGIQTECFILKQKDNIINYITLISSETINCRSFDCIN